MTETSIKPSPAPMSGHWSLTWRSVGHGPIKIHSQQGFSHLTANLLWNSITAEWMNNHVCTQTHTGEESLMPTFHMVGIPTVCLNSPQLRSQLLLFHNKSLLMICQWKPFNVKWQKRAMFGLCRGLSMLCFRGASNQRSDMHAHFRQGLTSCVKVRKHGRV